MDRKAHWDEVADAILAAMERGDQQKGYSLARTLAGIRNTARCVPCKADGTFPMDDEEILQIWSDHLAEERGMFPYKGEAPRQRRPRANIVRHGEEEIRQALNSLKQGKGAPVAAG